MTYASKQDLIDRYGDKELQQLSDLADPPGDAIDDTTVAGALTDADSEIDTYISARVTLPLTTVPANLVRVACVIARFRLWKDSASERVRQDYTDAVAWLKAVANGTVSIDQTPPSAGKPQIIAPDRVFTRDSMKCL